MSESIFAAVVVLVGVLYFGGQLYHQIDRERRRSRRKGKIARGEPLDHQEKMDEEDEQLIKELRGMR